MSDSEINLAAQLHATNKRLSELERTNKDLQTVIQGLSKLQLQDNLPPAPTPKKHAFTPPMGFGLASVLNIYYNKPAPRADPLSESTASQGYKLSNEDYTALFSEKRESVKSEKVGTSEKKGSKRSAPKKCGGSLYAESVSSMSSPSCASKPRPKLIPVEAALLHMLNHSSEEELLKLKRVGKVRAKYILQFRSTRPFIEIEDLAEIGISAKEIQKLVSENRWVLT